MPFLQRQALLIKVLNELQEVQLSGWLSAQVRHGKRQFITQTPAELGLNPSKQVAQIPSLHSRHLSGQSTHVPPSNCSPLAQAVQAVMLAASQSEQEREQPLHNPVEFLVKPLRQVSQTVGLLQLKQFLGHGAQTVPV